MMASSFVSVIISSGHLYGDITTSPIEPLNQSNSSILSDINNGLTVTWYNELSCLTLREAPTYWAVIG